MYVCNCNGLRKSEIQTALRAGARSPQGVHKQCGVMTKCGLCFDEMRQMIRTEARPDRARPEAFRPETIAHEG